MTTETRPALTEAQRRFVELERRKAEVKKFFDELKEATAAVVAEIGVGAFFQDEEGVVYQTCEPEGKFVHFERYDVKRTRREGEVKGSLSMKEAQAAGFVVPDRPRTKE